MEGKKAVEICCGEERVSVDPSKFELANLWIDYDYKIPICISKECAQHKEKIVRASEQTCHFLRIALTKEWDFLWQKTCDWKEMNYVLTKLMWNPQNFNVKVWKAYAFACQRLSAEATLYCFNVLSQLSPPEAKERFFRMLDWGEIYNCYPRVPLTLIAGYAKEFIPINRFGSWNALMKVPVAETVNAMVEYVTRGECTSLAACSDFFLCKCVLSTYIMGGAIIHAAKLPGIKPLPSSDVDMFIPSLEDISKYIGYAKLSEWKIYRTSEAVYTCVHPSKRYRFVQLIYCLFDNDRDLALSFYDHCLQATWCPYRGIFVLSDCLWSWVTKRVGNTFYGVDNLDKLWNLHLKGFWVNKEKMEKITHRPSPVLQTYDQLLTEDENIQRLFPWDTVENIKRLQPPPKHASLCRAWCYPPGEIDMKPPPPNCVCLRRGINCSWIAWYYQYKNMYVTSPDMIPRKFRIESNTPKKSMTMISPERYLQNGTWINERPPYSFLGFIVQLGFRETYAVVLRTGCAHECFPPKCFNCHQKIPLDKPAQIL